MNIYRLQGDLRSAQSIHIDFSQSETDYPWFYGQPKGDWCAPPGLFIKDLRKPVANFYYMASDIVFDEKVLQLMGDLLQKAGEIFTVQVKGAGQLYLFNPTVRLDALDRENYVPKGNIDGEPYGIKQYAFLPHILNKSSSNLFLLSTLEPGPLFAMSGLNDENDEFVGRFLKHNLTGLEMTE